LGAGGGGGMTGSALMPGWLNSSVCGSSKSVPEKVTSTVVPALPPQGVSVNNFGFGKLFPAGGCPHVVPAQAKNAHIRTGSVSDRPGVLTGNKETRRMNSSLYGGKTVWETVHPMAGRSNQSGEHTPEAKAGRIQSNSAVQGQVRHDP